MSVSSGPEEAFRTRVAVGRTISVDVTAYE